MVGGYTGCVHIQHRYIYIHTHTHTDIDESDRLVCETGPEAVVCMSREVGMYYVGSRYATGPLSRGDGLVLSMQTPCVPCMPNECQGLG